MNSRERVLTALDHQEPDRIPIDLGGRQTTFMVGTYEAFKLIWALIIFQHSQCPKYGKPFSWMNAS